MQLQFTKDVGQRFKKGDVRDYPKRTWTDIERSAGRDLASFTRADIQPVEDKPRRLVAREAAAQA